MAAAVSAPLSPSTSPRLPSPPPFPEIQIGPRSPGMGPTGPPSASSLSNEDPSKPRSGPLRRIRPGTKSTEMTSGPPLIPLHDLDTPFQLQEHLAALYHHHTHDIKISPPTIQPITHATAELLATPPPKTDAHLWLYELCRFLVIRANDLLVAFFQDTPPCSSTTCPEMRASEWQYLCAVHDPPKSCCAIDYCCHTLDWAANMLTSQKQFPSRLSLGTPGGGAAGQSGGGEQGGLRHLTNIMRRVYRIFAHAWFQHRGVFWEVEGRTGLYVFFKTVCDVHGLIEPTNYTVPGEAEGIVTSSYLSSGGDERSGSVVQGEQPGVKEREGLPILQRREQSQANQQQTQQPPLLPAQQTSGEQNPAFEEQAATSTTTTTTSTGATTRRHKHTPSTGVAVAPITESEDEEADEEAKREKERQKAQTSSTGASPEKRESANEPRQSEAGPFMDPTAPSAATPAPHPHPSPQRVATVVLASPPSDQNPNEKPEGEESSILSTSEETVERSESPEKVTAADVTQTQQEPQPGVAEHEPVVSEPDVVGVEPEDGLEKTQGLVRGEVVEEDEQKGKGEEGREDAGGGVA